MIAALTFVTALAQAAAPSLPAGVSPEFQASVLAVESRLSAGDFPGAKALLAKLPQRAMPVQWDDSALSASQKSAFAGYRQAAFQTWGATGLPVIFQVGAASPLRIQFAGQNPLDPVNRLPEAVVFERANGALTATISLVRNDPPVAVTANDVVNSVVRAIGTYFGVESMPFATSAMTHLDTPSRSPMGLAKYEAELAIENLAVVEALRKAANAGQKLSPKASAVETPTERIDLGKVYQGEQKDFAVSIRNTGTATAQLWIRPDCGCITAPGIVKVEPNQSTSVLIKFDSSLFLGEATKHLYLISNDPKTPVRTFDFHVNVVPLYRFLSPTGNVAILDDNGGSADVYLTFSDREPFQVKSFQVNGIRDTKVTYEPWSGSMADPEQNGPEIPRKGYKFHLEFPASIPPGRVPSSLIVFSDNPTFPYAQYHFAVQKGIVALPDDLFLADMTKAIDAKVIVARPGRPFKILSAVADSEALHVTIDPSGSDNYTLLVKYDGRAALGPFNQQITVTTDDPKQPTIVVTVTGTVR